MKYFLKKLYLPIFVVLLIFILTGCNKADFPVQNPGLYENLQNYFAEDQQQENQQNSPEDLQLIEIADPVLENVIREALEKPQETITAKDMHSIFELSYVGREGIKIKNLNGLEYAKNLQKLILRNNSIEDLEPVSGLLSLRELNLQGNKISDISPLCNLANLKKLNVTDNFISDISPLSEISLSQLRLRNNKVDDISPLSNHTELEGMLCLHYNKIVDISPISNMAKLKRLCLHGNKVTDIKMLLDLKKLEWLDITGNPINDTDSIEKLKESGVEVLF